MDKALIVYWSATGNTEAMANHIAAGMRAAGAAVDVKAVSESSAADALAYDNIIFGCPSMGAEVLEEDEFEPFFAEVEGGLSGKTVALFGSYDWGDGQWMRDWHERTAATGARLPVDDLIVNLTPEGPECEAFGKKLAAV